MVLEEGRKDGVGIWEISGYKRLEKLINSAIDEGIEKQEYINEEDISVEDILIMGSYGSGMGVPGKSDLDIVVLVSYKGDVRSNDYSNAMKDIAGSINYNEPKILSGFSEFDGLEAYVYPFLEKSKHLGKMSMHEPVEYYYNLTEDQKRSYY